MIVVENRFRVAEGYEEEFVERFSDSQGNVSAQPGFVSFELLVPANDDTETFVAQTYWESVEDFEAWTESQDFADAHADQPPHGMFLEHPNLEVHEVAFRRTAE